MHGTINMKFSGNVYYKQSVSNCKEMCVELFMRYTRIDAGDIKTVAHKGDTTFPQWYC
jgi:hypothetical protein